MRGGLSFNCRRAVLLLGAAWLIAAPAHGQTAIQITRLRDLDFGGCDNVGGTTYTVTATASQGGGACFGAQSAQFTVVGDPNRRARLTLPNKVDITNGSETLSVTLSDSEGSKNICLGTGTLTIYVGGSLRIPPGGLTTFGVFTVPTQIQVDYRNGNC